jgi:hypothetical protein
MSDDERAFIAEPSPHEYPSFPTLLPMLALTPNPSPSALGEGLPGPYRTLLPSPRSEESWE